MSYQSIFIVLSAILRVLSSSKLTIATFNLAKGATLNAQTSDQVHYNLESTARKIIEHNIDIIALQEQDVNTNRNNLGCYDDPQEIVDSIYDLYGRQYAARFVNANSFNQGCSGHSPHGEYGNSIIFNLQRFEDPLNNKVERYIYDFQPEEQRAAIASKFIFYDTDNIEMGLRSLWFVSTHLTSKSGDYAFKQLIELMNIVNTYSYPTIICGDFNIDYNDNYQHDRLDEILYQYGFQNIMESNGEVMNTHNYAGDFSTDLSRRLDFCVFRDNRNWFDVDLSSIRYISPKAHDGTVFSDHLGIVFDLNFK